jgi:hypothetical protein
MQFFKENIYREVNGPSCKLAFDEFIRKTKLILEDMTLTNFAQVYENNKSRIDLASENLIELYNLGEYWDMRTIFKDIEKSMRVISSTILSKC